MAFGAKTHAMEKDCQFSIQADVLELYPDIHAGSTHDLFSTLWSSVTLISRVLASSLAASAKPLFRSSQSSRIISNVSILGRAIISRATALYFSISCKHMYRVQNGKLWLGDDSASLHWSLITQNNIIVSFNCSLPVNLCLQSIIYSFTGTDCAKFHYWYELPFFLKNQAIKHY